MTRQYPQHKKTKPVRCSARIRKLNMRPKLDVVFQHFTNVKRSSILATNTADSSVKSTAPFENEDASLGSLSINRSIPSTDTKAKKGRPKKRVTHSRAVINDSESSELLRENLAENLSISSEPSAENQKMPKKNSAILSSENSGLPESPELFNSFEGQLSMSLKNSLILSMNSKTRRGKQSAGESAVLSLANGSIEQSEFADNVVSPSEKISSPVLFSSSSAKKNNGKELVERSSPLVYPNTCTKSSELSNNSPVVSTLSENCSNSLPSLRRTRAKEGTSLRERIGTRSFLNGGNLKSPEILNNSISSKHSSSSSSANSDVPSINLKTRNEGRKEQSLSIPLSNDNASQSFDFLPALPVSLPIRNLELPSLNKLTSFLEMGGGNAESKIRQMRLFEGDDETKRRNDASLREYECTSSKAVFERQVSFGEENGSIDDLCSLFSDVELQTKGFQLKKNEQNLDPEIASTSRNEPKSKMECKFCCSMYSHLPELNSNPETTSSHSKEVPVFHTNETANLYDVDSKELDIDIDSVLKSITKIEVRIPDYEPFTEGECWWEGFDEWSSS